MKTSESKAGATSEAVFNTSWKNLNHLYRIEQKRLTELISFLLRWEKIKIMVLCYQNCSDLLWEKIILVIEIEITRTIYSNSEKSEQFLVTECFITCSLKFLIYNKLEVLEFKLEKKTLGFRNMDEKLEKLCSCTFKRKLHVTFLK